MLRMTRRLVLVSAGSSAAIWLAGCQATDIGHMTMIDGLGASERAAGNVSRARSSNGLAAMAPDTRLESAAIEQARLMSGTRTMKHTAARGRDFETRMKERGISSPAAENLAHGRFDVAGVVDVWMNSPPHRRNMLDPRFGKFGLGYAPGNDGRNYWAMVLGA